VDAIDVSNDERNLAHIYAVWEMRKPFESGYWLYAKHDAGKQELTLHCSSIWAHTYATQIALRSIWANNALMEWTTDVRTAKDFHLSMSSRMITLGGDLYASSKTCHWHSISISALIWGNSQYHSTNFFQWSSNEIQNHLVGTQSSFILSSFLMYSDSYVQLQVGPCWQD